MSLEKVPSHFKFSRKMQIFDFPEAILRHFLKFKKFLSRFPVTFSDTFFSLDYVSRPQLTKKSKQSESLLFGRETILGEKWAGSRDFRMTSSGHEKNIQGVISLRLLKKQTKRKSASLEPLISLLALVVGKLWPKNNELISQSPRTAWSNCF